MISHFIPSSQNLVSTGVHKTPLDGLYYLPHKRFDDQRGFYSELVRIPELTAVTGQPFIIQQTNLSFSKQNVIRGFHAEAWNKLLTVIEGVCFCAWADIRPDSLTFGHVVTMNLGKGDEAQFGSVYVSQGIANSFCVTSGPASYLYGVDKLYSDRDLSKDQALSLFDPDLGVVWPLPTEDLIISSRDTQSSSLRELFPQKYQSKA